jgi:DNA-binding Xre family transcriptional regulator
MNVQKLKGLLREQKYTYKSFSKIIGISAIGLSLIMKNEKTNTETLLKMCDVLNVTPNDLLL